MNRRRRALRIALLAGLAPLGGCSAVGGLAGGLAGGIGSLLNLAIYLAAIAAPLYLSYYLYHKDDD
jgi:hypothetical protein